MPLQFSDFSHYYQGHGMTDAQQVAHFEAFADLMDCLTRHFWREEPASNRLGITLDPDTPALPGEVKSPDPLDTLFNAAAADGAARKKEP